MLTQFGLSLVIPLLICIGICWFICDRTNVGAWIYILGFFFGLGASFTTAYKFYMTTMEKQKREEKEKKPKISFNRH